MTTVRRKKWADAFQLRFAQALIAVFRTLFRFMECFGPETRRSKFRAFRAKMQAMEQDKRTVLEQIGRNPRDSTEILGNFISSHGRYETQQWFGEHRLRMQAIQQESDTLQAIRSRAGENTADAIAGYRNYIETHPNSHLAYSYLGGMLQGTKDWDASLEAYHQAEQIAGDDKVFGSMARLHIGRVLQEKGDLEAAAVQYRRIIATASEEQEVAVNFVFFYLGNVLNEQGRRDEARSAWKQAAKRDSTKILAKKAREMLKANP